MRNSRGFNWKGTIPSCREGHDPLAPRARFPIAGVRRVRTPITGEVRKWPDERETCAQLLPRPIPAGYPRNSGLEPGGGARGRGRDARRQGGRLP